MNDIEFLIDTDGDTLKINEIDSKSLITHSNGRIFNPYLTIS
ncbi:hypothetical protein RST01_21270 [Rummeliibacillus stabekisii]|nr:hypothetical protein RST01_21270 [Rummeliibacillus stabekisii]